MSSPNLIALTLWALMVAAGCYGYLRYKGVTWLEYTALDDVISIIGFLALLVFGVSLFALGQEIAWNL